MPLIRFLTLISVVGLMISCSGRISDVTNTLLEAQTLAREGSHEEALELLDEKIRRNDRDDRYYLLRGAIYQSLDPVLFMEFAIDNYLEALQQNPESFVIRRSLGTSYAALEQNDEAVRYLESSIDYFNSERSIDRDLEPFGPLANAYYDLGFYDDALEAIERSLEINAQDGWHQLLLGLILSQSGDVEVLTSQFKVAYAIESTNNVITQQYGFRLIEMQAFDIAQAHYERFTTLDDATAGPAWARAGLGVVALLTSELEEAKRQLDIANGLDERVTETLQYLSFWHFARGADEAAIASHVEYRIATIANETVHTDLSISEFIEFYEDSPVFQMVRRVYGR